MAERWAKWEEPLAIEPVHQGIWLPDGRTLGEFQITWSAEMIERFRAGYKCVNCLEPQSEAWPERCSLCGYPMRTEQASYFAREYGGERQLGRLVSISDEMEGLEERRRKEDEKRAREDAQLGRRRLRRRRGIRPRR